MTRLLCAIAILVGLGGAVADARAQLNTLGFYSDAAGSSCFLNYTDVGVATVHILFGGTLPSGAVQFTAVTPPCWTGAVFLSDVISPPYLSLGTSQDPLYGLSVAFASCKEPPFYVGSINHLVTDVSAECCAYAPGPATIHTAGGDLHIIGTVDCSVLPFGEIRSAQSKGLVVNAKPLCTCEQPLSTTTTTWGKIKSMYQ